MSSLIDACQRPLPRELLQQVSFALLLPWTHNHCLAFDLLDYSGEFERAVEQRVKHVKLVREQVQHSNIRGSLAELYCTANLDELETRLQTWLNESHSSGDLDLSRVESDAYNWVDAMIQGQSPTTIDDLSTGRLYSRVCF